MRRLLIFLIVLLIAPVASSVSNQDLKLHLTGGTYNPYNYYGVNSSRTLNTMESYSTVERSVLLDNNIINNKNFSVVGSWYLSPVFASDILIENTTLELYLKKHSGGTTIRLLIEISELNYTNNNTLFTYSYENSYGLTNSYLKYPINITDMSHVFRNNTYLNLTIKAKKFSDTDLNINMSIAYNSTTFDSKMNSRTFDNIRVQDSSSHTFNGTSSATFGINEDVIIRTRVRDNIGTHDARVNINVYRNSQLFNSSTSSLLYTDGYNNNYSSTFKFSEPDTYTIETSATDNSGNTDSHEFNITITSTNPIISNLKTDPVSPAIYTSERFYQFNATITDDTGVANVTLEFDGINHTVTSRNGDEYYYSIFDLAAGSYNYKWHAEDDNKNRATKDGGQYIVDKSSIPSHMELNGTLDRNKLDYQDPAIVNVTSYSDVDGGTIKLHNNISGFVMEDVDRVEYITNHSVGHYMYTAEFIHQNYSAQNKSYVVGVVESGQNTEPVFAFTSYYNNFTENQLSSFNLTIENTGDGSLQDSVINLVLPDGWSNLSPLRRDLGYFAPGQFFNITWIIEASSNASGYTLVTNLSGLENGTNDYREYLENHNVTVFKGATFNVTEYYNNDSDPFYLNLTIDNIGYADFVNTTAEINYTEKIELDPDYNSSYNIGNLSALNFVNVSWKFIVNDDGNITYTISGTDFNSGLNKTAIKVVQVSREDDENTDGGSPGGGSGGGSSGGSGGSGGGAGNSQKTNNLVIKKLDFLFDVIIGLDKNVYLQGDPVNTSITLLKMQGDGLVDVVVKLRVLSDNGTVIWRETKTVAVLDSKVENIVIPTGGFTAGKYLVTVDGEYPNAVASAGKSFTILPHDYAQKQAEIAQFQKENEERARKLEKEAMILRWSVIGALILVFGLVAALVIKKREREIEHYLREIIEHLKSVHTCKTCGMVFRDIHTYEYHLKTHEENKEKDWGN